MSGAWRERLLKIIGNTYRVGQDLFGGQHVSVPKQDFDDLLEAARAVAAAHNAQGEAEPVAFNGDVIDERLVNAAYNAVRDARGQVPDGFVLGHAIKAAVAVRDALCGPAWQCPISAQDAKRLEQAGWVHVGRGIWKEPRR